MVTIVGVPQIQARPHREVAMWRQIFLDGRELGPPIGSRLRGGRPDFAARRWRARLCAEQATQRHRRRKAIPEARFCPESCVES